MNQSIKLTNLQPGNAIAQVLIGGQGGDRWEFPPNPPYWPITVERLGDDVATLSWVFSQTRGPNHVVSVRFADGKCWVRTQVSSGDVLDLGWVSPSPEQSPPPATTGEVEELRARVGALRGRVEELAGQLAREQARLRAMREAWTTLNREGLVQ